MSFDATDGKQKERLNKKAPGRALMSQVKRSIVYSLFYGLSKPDISDPKVLDRYEVNPHGVTSIALENLHERVSRLEAMLSPSGNSQSREWDKRNVVPIRRVA